MNGVLFLDKPSGLGSNEALQKARRLLDAAKAGHTGTLDPMASGLLPLTFGEATKFSQQLLDADKRYVATARLGVTTTTGDAEGEVLKERPVGEVAGRIGEVLASLTGPIEQVPPMYSALKRDGRPLYELARKGIEIERAPRAITIFELRLIELRGTALCFEVRCSKGTYVRVLAEEIGARLGCGAHLTALRRTAIGPFDLDASVGLEHFAACSLEERDRLLAPVDALVGHLPALSLSAAEAGTIAHGGALAREGLAESECRLYGPCGFLGLGRVDASGRLWPKRLFATTGAAETT